jgi:hypothetical protein
MRTLFAAVLAMGAVSVTADVSEARKYRASGKHHSHHKPAKKSHHKSHHGHHYHHHNHDNWHHGWNHYGRWVAGGVAAGVTAAAIGSAVYSLPAGCRVVYSGGVKYWDCGGAWYRARYRGSNVTYVAVNAP